MSELVERYGAGFLALVSAAALVIWRDNVTAAYVAQTISLDALYSAVLQWASIQTGFLFGIFGFVAGKNDGFIAELRSTKEMALFVSYMRWSTLLGFALTLASIPVMIFKLGIGDGGPWTYSIFVSWCALAVWAFFSFARVAYLFGILIRTKDNYRIVG